MRVSVVNASVCRLAPVVDTGTPLFVHDYVGLFVSPSMLQVLIYSIPIFYGDEQNYYLLAIDECNDEDDSRDDDLDENDSDWENFGNTDEDDDEEDADHILSI
ncbi:hypothetical protein VNO77_26017 [Canavalia gladiata]|uniref:Uncharacterized protein n=1 Tax=Canavalia gladiata TaxID=3824 RepID=A0AAN9KWC1_CANGL